MHRTELELIEERTGFSGSYLAVRYLRQRIEDSPYSATAQTADALLFLIRSPRFDRKKQVFFLFSEAADTLIELALSTDQTVRIIEALHEILLASTGPRTRAVGNALGRLPVTFPLAPLAFPPCASARPCSIEALIGTFPSKPLGPSSWQGRSLVVPLEDRRLGIIKFANSEDNAAELARENFWQHWLRKTTRSASWQLPVPLAPATAPLFRVTGNLPHKIPSGLYQGICIAYITGRSYFEYPNENVTARPFERIAEIFFDTAETIASLAARGIIHTALIPLFHNRVQQGRRTDNGAYLWEHGGRLDQWLDSCKFPNFALSGLRDFEHLIQEPTSKNLRHYIGEHILSFILVMGSYFRGLAPERRGLTTDGLPEDTRDLFDPAKFEALVTGVCRQYFKGISGEDMPEALEKRVPDLVRDLILAMGQDRDMEEILRAEDQNRMDDTAYTRFLATRGISARIPPKGVADIVLLTGPHLGGFNRPISVSGLVDFLFSFSALCMGAGFVSTHPDPIAGMDQMVV